MNYIQYPSQAQNFTFEKLKNGHLQDLILNWLQYYYSMIFPPTDDSYCIYLVVLLLSENDNLTKLSTICSASIEYKT